jgi:molybdenum cofactor cytidylyltransferase
MGPLSSIQIGLAALDGVSAVIIHPVDHPEVSLQTISRLKNGHLAHPACILIPCFAGKRGHPVLFPSKFFPDLRKAPLEIGARHVVHRYPGSTMLIEVNDPGILINVNTPGDYEELMRR